MYLVVDIKPLLAVPVAKRVSHRFRREILEVVPRILDSADGDVAYDHFALRVQCIDRGLSTIWEPHGQGQRIWCVTAFQLVTRCSIRSRVMLSVSKTHLFRDLMNTIGFLLFLVPDPHTRQRDGTGRNEDRGIHSKTRHILGNEAMDSVPQNMGTE